MLAALLAASLALAAQVRDVDGYLGRMDADGDGRVSLAEYQAWMGYGFDAMDRDHDGVLSAPELPGGRGAPLSRDAHHARLAAAFARQDRNRDGVLDATELAAPPR
jgi:Ca2+-binding EF-hand superfamily protein